jgi:2'-hydroxyisoflavone reductase
MKILILGGTRFVGRHLTDAALTRGYEVTLFNRGRSNPTLFPKVERLQGDRDGGLGVLKGHRWDAVIDTCGYVPRLVRASAELLADVVEHYTFISSISVYADPSNRGQDEDSLLGTLEDEATEEVTGATYGPLKVRCEQVAEAAMPARLLTIRAGLIVGPHDNYQHFPYWPVRVAQGGEVLAPGKPDKRLEFIDCRDMAEWIVRMVEARRTGIYNTTQSHQRLTMILFLNECIDTSQSNAQLTWVSQYFLQANNVQRNELPLPWEYSPSDGLGSINISKALKAGLTFRPLAETIRDTLAWHKSLPAGAELKAGMSRERETELLRKWHQEALLSS